MDNDAKPFKAGRRGPKGPHAGHFKKGEPAKNRGLTKPEKDFRADVRQLCRAHTPELVEFLMDTVRDSNAPYKVRLAACTEALSRAYGKPAISAEVTITASNGDLSALTDAQLLEMITIEQGQVLEHEA